MHTTSSYSLNIIYNIVPRLLLTISHAKPIVMQAFIDYRTSSLYLLNAALHNDRYLGALHLHQRGQLNSIHCRDT